jgi:hypothetical protein
MKTFNLNFVLLLSLSFLLSSVKTMAQNIQFADIHVETVLLNDPSINTNGDAAIQKTEAMSFVGSIDLSNVGAHNLGGIEYFTQLKTLIANGNQLTQVDLSNNTSLERLVLSSNKLTGVDVSGLTELRYLDVSDNYLNELDVNNNELLEVLKCSDNNLSDLELFQNVELITLFCSRNEIVGLDLSENVNLSVLYCTENGMTSLNLANNNNTNIGAKSIDVSNNSLNCIQVDDASYADHQWSARKDVNAYFSEDCNSISAPNNDESAAVLSVYPNPTTDVVTIDMGSIEKDVDVEIVSSTGAMVFSQSYDELESMRMNIDLTAGMYVMNVKTASGKKEAIKLIVQ